jgi:hypothetical protein
LNCKDCSKIAILDLLFTYLFVKKKPVLSETKLPRWPDFETGSTALRKETCLGNLQSINRYASIIKSSLAFKSPGMDPASLFRRLRGFSMLAEAVQSAATRAVWKQPCKFPPQAGNLTAWFTLRDGEAALCGLDFILLDARLGHYPQLQ